MEALVYDNRIITGHKLYPVCGMKLQDVSEKDYHGKKYFDEPIECLDMDKYEDTECAGDKKRNCRCCYRHKEALRQKQILKPLSYAFGTQNGI